MRLRGLSAILHEGGRARDAKAPLCFKYGGELLLFGTYIYKVKKIGKNGAFERAPVGAAAPCPRAVARGRL